MLKVAVIDSDDWMPCLLLGWFCAVDCWNHIHALFILLIFKDECSSLLFLNHGLTKALFELLVEKCAVLRVRSLLAFVALAV